MRRIRENCGSLIEEAAGGDPARGALLAALTANESGGSARAYRFEPNNYERLTKLLAGADENVDGLTRPQLEGRLGVVAEGERDTHLKRLAGLHGHTHLPGYCSILWNVPLEALIERRGHFHLAARRLDELCRQFGLEPRRNAAELGRCWNAGHPNGATRSSLYSWRLQTRLKMYLDATE